MSRSGMSHHRSAWLSVLLGLALIVGSLLPASFVFAQEGPAPAAASASDSGQVPDAVIGGVNLGNLTNYLLVFTDGRTDANWQGATKGFVGDVAVDGIQADERTSGGVPYAGTIYTNDTTLSAWQDIVDQNVGQASGSTGQTARITGLTADLVSAIQQINSLTATPGYTSRTAGSLNGTNTQNGVCERTVVNVTSEGAIATITGDACDVFVLRWDTDANPSNGYQGQAKFQSGDAIIPAGGLKPSNFINVAGEIGSSGGGSNPPAPYPQGPRLNDGTGALCTGCANFSGGGFFTGYWLTTGSPDNLDPVTGLYYGEQTSLSNGIFVGGWYSLNTKFSMTSGTSGVYVSPNPATAPSLDFGDAPTAAQSGFASSYPTTLANDGARHTPTGPTLGTVRDVEADGQPTANADGDDLNGVPDDEDGVTIPTFMRGQTAGLTVNASAAAKLDAWIDWNRDGDWGDANEQVATNLSVNAGNNTLNVPVPAGASLGASYARFRLSTAGGLLVTGAATDGEVEDYKVTIQAPSTDLQIVKTASPDPALVGQNLTYSLVVTNNGPNGATGVTVQDTLPAGVTFVSATPTQGTCSFAAGVVTCNLGNIANGGNATITIVVTVNSALEMGASSGKEASGDVVVTSALADAPAAPEATTTVPGLGEAARFTLLGLDGGYLQIHDNSELIGNVGFSANTSNNECSKVGGSNGPFIGIIYAALGVNINQSSTCLNPGPTGGVLQGAASTAMLAQANTDANNAFTFYNSLPANVTIGTAGDVENFNNSAGANNIFVADITTVNVNGSPWTLTGHPGGDDIFVFRISGSFDWSHGVVAPVNVRPERILWLFTNPGGGQHVLINKADNVFLGTILSPYDTLIEYHNPATFHGAIIAKQIYIHSASKISGFPFQDLDFGDAPDTGSGTGAGNYSTLLSDNGPRHVMVSGLTLGTVIDGETDGQPNTGATGDDTNGSPDDEDAVGVLSFTNGSSPSVSVAVTNNYQTGNPLAGQQAFLKCWMDLNGNGSFADAGEASAQITIPASSGTANYNVSFGTLAANGTTYLRCRLSLTASEVANPNGAATSGEVEDHAVTIGGAASYDFGDLPDTGAGTGTGNYQTLFADSGPRHMISGPVLGSAVDSEADGQPNATATGDNIAGATPNDEQGVTIPTLTAGQTATVMVDSSAAGKVNAFFDWTNDGDFADPGEVIAEVSVVAGNNNLSVPVPANAITGTPVGARFRLSTAGGLASTGNAPDGEVEDYMVTIQVAPPCPPGQIYNVADVTGNEPDPVLSNNSDDVCTNVNRLGAIGNYVWVDENSDGYQDAGEPGIPNITVKLYDTTGNVVATTYTDAHGGYLFDNVAPGSYFVRVDGATIPTGMTQTPPSTLPNADFGNQDQSTGANDYGYLVTIGGTQPLENLTADFGYNYNPAVCVNDPTDPACTPTPATATIGDRVWIDANGNGAQDPEEVGITGVTVKLYTAGPDGIFGTADDVEVPVGPDGILGTGDDAPGGMLTNANGNYLFDNLPPDAYVVKVTPPAGYTQTGDPDTFGSPCPICDNQTTTPVVLGPGDVFLNADFGYQPPASQNNSIGDKVWFDADADGVGPNGNGAAPGDDNTEQGIPGVTVALIKDANGDGIWKPLGDDGVPGGTGNNADEPIIATDTTDANGDYLFPGLPDGNYLVWVNDTDNVLGDKTPTYDSNGGTAPTGSGAPTGVASSTVLGLSASDLDSGSASGSPVNDLTQDFGYTAPGQTSTTGLIGDTVWFDLNNSGGATQDAGEPGIEGVAMELLGPGPDGIWGNGDDQVLGTTTTDENGKYYFGGLKLDDGVGAAGAEYRTRVAASNFAAGGVLEGMSNTYAAGAAVPSNTGNTVTLTAGNKINLDQDFSYTGTTGAIGSIGNRVWQDLNANGIYEPTLGETAIADVSIDVYRDLNGNGKVDPGEPKINTQTTDPGGLYLFSRLPTVGNGATGGGAYVVNVTDGAGKVFGWWHSLGSQDAYSNSGNDAADNSKVDPFGVEIGGTRPVNNLNVDFGYYVKPASLGNYVWDDTNKDGIQDTDEPGIDGVPVQLVITWPTGDTTTLTVFTGDDPNTAGIELGWYGFGNLLLDEDYSKGSSISTPTATEPAHELSAATPTGKIVTIVEVLGSTVYEDSNNPDATVGVPQKGQTDVSFSQNGTTPASYDFGFYTSDSPDPGNKYDWGDLPSNYPTLSANNGAVHKASNVLFMGVCLDAEGNGQPNAAATGDNNNISALPTARFGVCSAVNDEDGVSKAPGRNGSNWAVGTVANNLGGGLTIVIGAGTGVPQVFMDFAQTGNTLVPMTLYYDPDGPGGSPVVQYMNTPLSAGSRTFYFDIPANVNLQTPVATRVRLSSTGGLSPTGLTLSGEVEDYFFNEGPPLAVNLAAFDAVAQGDHVLVTWETVSEVDNTGFNLYRSASADGERTQLGFVPAQAPGSPIGASYSFEDADVVEGQTYWYWLEDMDVSGAATLHGPVSVAFQAPTAVTLTGLTADASAAVGSGLPWLLIMAGLAFVLLLGVSQLRRAKQA